MKTIEQKAKDFVNQWLSDEVSTSAKTMAEEAYIAGVREAAPKWIRTADRYPEPKTICLCRAYGKGWDDETNPDYFTAIFDGIEEWENSQTGEHWTEPIWIRDWGAVTPIQYGGEITAWIPFADLIPAPDK